MAECGCDVCPVCKKCLPLLELKQAVLPDGGNGEAPETPIAKCPMCSCPKIDWDDITSDEKAFCVFQKLIKTGTNEYNSLVLSFIAAFSGNELYRGFGIILNTMNNTIHQFEPIIKY